MDRKRSSWILTPVMGILLYGVLYISATRLYPGGSQADKHSAGFSWMNNYWCNLLNEKAINGLPNPAKPVAITGMAILCLSLSFFWFVFAKYMITACRSRLVMQVSGMLAMGIAFFLFTSFNHDFIINLASMFGLVATAGVFAGLYRNKWYALFVFGLFNLLLVVLNNYVYYGKGLIVYLPVVQKISFASFLIWISCINVKVYRRVRPEILSEP